MTAIPITGIGAVTPVGLSAPATCAALRAGITRITPLEVDDTHGTVGDSPPPVGGRVPLEWFDGGPVEEEWPGHERFGASLPVPEHLKIEEGMDRLIRLAVPAVVESWSSAGGEGTPPESWGLYVGLDSEEDQESFGRLSSAITQALGGFKPKVVEILPYGRASGLGALFRASSAIKEGRITGAFVGGVDSLIRPSVRVRLLEQGILKDPDSNPQGILPGEAACFCVLEKNPQKNGAGPLLTAVSLGHEPTAETEDPNLGEGLTQALRAVHSAVPFSYAPLVICDLNGDRYRGMEWGLAKIRVFAGLPNRLDVPGSGEFWHPADCTGDTGAASGILDCIWGMDAIEKGYGGGGQVLVWGASDGPLRAGAVIANRA
jgi:3-oxoacyl-[acyl-carrier-protein] synthase-1